jgi:tRNA A58 N-methylase Trm61
MAVKLTSPHRFNERILLIGGGGSGKTESVLTVARHVTGDVWVYDNDYSFAYNRALSTTFSDVDEAGNVHVYEAQDTTWESAMETLTEMVSKADADNGDWLVIDSISPTWGWVQNWFQEKVHGEDLAKHLIGLRAQYVDDDKAFNRAVLDDMNWPLVKKEYQRLYRIIQQWKGHLIITAEVRTSRVQAQR